MNIRSFGKVFFLISLLMLVKATTVLSKETPSGPIVVNGDEVEYFPDQKKVVGKGNISIDYKGSVLTADFVTVYLDTKDAEAEGNVVLTRGPDEFHGKKLRYNFETKQGILTDAKGKVLPWYFGGEKIERRGENEFLVEGGYLTTCDLPHPHYAIRTKRIEIHPDDRIVARNVIFQTGGVPVFYAPFYSRSIKKGEVQRAGARVLPGYSSRWGAYALSTWALPLEEGISGNVHLDERTHRGFGSGLDLNYETEWGQGELKSYYINDKRRQSPIDLRKDRDRYRGRWLHRWELSPRTTFLGEYQKWSDRFITRDYFNGEFSEDFRPDTRATVVHDSDFLTTALTAQRRVNHFFTQTERLPELQLTSQRLALGETGFFYEGEARAGSLVRAVAGSDNTTTERADFFSELSYPKEILNLQAIPRVSVRQTYYGKDTTDEEDVVRGLMTTGFDLSTRIRRFYDVETTFWGMELSGLRHILEPGLKYRYTPEPTLPASRLALFDEIDTLTENNRLTFSLDNKFQTRRLFGNQKQVVDFIDFLLTANYDFGEGWDGRFVDLVGGLELRPSSFWGAFLDTTYDMERRDLTEANLDLYALAGEKWRLDFLHRYEKDFSNQLTTKLSCQLHPKWKVELFDRFEVNGRQFEEEELIVTRDLHCWEGSIGFNVRDTEDLERPKAEYAVYLALRLKAFPEAPLELGNKANISHRFIGNRRSGQSD